MGDLGIISDTHGLLRPEATARLRGCDRIIHAGDVGKEEVLVRLNEIAPTLAVRGNVDRGGWAELLPLSTTMICENVPIHVVHDRHDLNPASAAGARIIISGHSHRMSIEDKAGTIYLNPGSIGPRRFRLPVTMAVLHAAQDGSFEIETITLLD